jgi:hypothetical protein
MQMLEWDEQISEFQHNWVKQQQELLGDWLGTLQNAGNAPPACMWQDAVGVMEQQVNSVLAVQKQSLLSLAENSKHIQGMPDAYSQWLQQLEKGLELWTEAQQRLWQVWFEMLRSTAPAAQTQTPGEALVKNWQDMARRAISVQEQWLTNWTGPRTAAEKPPRGTPSKSSTARRSTKAEGKGNGQGKGGKSEPADH